MPDPAPRLIAPSAPGAGLHRLVAALLAASATIGFGACGGGTADPIRRLAAHAGGADGDPADLLLAVDGRRLAGTWVGDLARAALAILPADRRCLIDAVLRAPRALLVRRGAGWSVLLAGDDDPCQALSRIAPGVLAGTVGGRITVGAAAPAGEIDALATGLRPAGLALVARAPARAGNAAGAADEDVPALVVVRAQLVDGGDRARAQVSGRDVDQVQLAVGTALPSPALRIDGRGPDLAVTLELATQAQRDQVRLWLVGWLAARVALPAVAPVERAACPGRGDELDPAVACSEDGRRFTVGPDRAAALVAALAAAPLRPRVAGGRVDGLVVGDLEPVALLRALGWRSGDAVLALDDRPVRDGADLGARFVPTVRPVRLTVRRDDRVLVIDYRPAPAR